MILRCFTCGPLATNSYIIACEYAREAILIDPAEGSLAKLLPFVEQEKLSPQLIILTHSHWDHIGDVAKAKRQFDAKVLVHELDRFNLEKPGSDLIPCWLNIEKVQPDFLLQGGEEFPTGQLRFKVIHTPGHTPGALCLFCPVEKVLFSGDTLFRGSIGNISFPTSEPEKMWLSLEKLAKLPFMTRVYPGHGPSTTIGEESWLPRAKELFG